MRSARLGNFPLQRLGVRGNSMRASQPPTEVAPNLHTRKVEKVELSAVDPDVPDYEANVQESGWVLARIWKFGEFSGQDAGTPMDSARALRARKLVGKVIVIQRLGGADGSEPDFVQIKRLIKIDILENGELGFWVEGDNKSASTDSRHWGYVKGSEIRGRVIFSYRVM